MFPTQQHRNNFQQSQCQQDLTINPSLRGLTGRSTAGKCLIIAGGLDIIIAIILIGVPLDPTDWNSCDSVDRFLLGIWGGVFAIITGGVGIGSKRRKVVITYMILCIIAVFLCVAGIVFFFGITVCTSITTSINGTPDTNKYRLHMFLYISMSIVCTFQMVMSIIGASFTCGAICGTGTVQVQHLVMNQPTDMSLQTAGAPGAYPPLNFETIRQSPQTSPPSYDDVIANQIQPKWE